MSEPLPGPIFGHPTGATFSGHRGLPHFRAPYSGPLVGISNLPKWGSIRRAWGASGKGPRGARGVRGTQSLRRSRSEGKQVIGTQRASGWQRTRPGSRSVQERPISRHTSVVSSTSNNPSSVQPHEHHPTSAHYTATHTCQTALQQPPPKPCDQPLHMSLLHQHTTARLHTNRHNKKITHYLIPLTPDKLKLDSNHHHVLSIVHKFDPKTSKTEKKAIFGSAEPTMQMSVASN